MLIIQYVVGVAGTKTVFVESTVLIQARGIWASLIPRMLDTSMRVCTSMHDTF